MPGRIALRCLRPRTARALIASTLPSSQNSYDDRCQTDEYKETQPLHDCLLRLAGAVLYRKGTISGCRTPHGNRAPYPCLTSFCMERRFLPGIIMANSASDTSATYMSPRESTAIPWGA